MRTMVLEIDKLGYRRLHTMDSFKARLTALGLSEPDFSRVLFKDFDKTYFRVATGRDLQAKPAMANGAWGKTGELVCPVCKGKKVDAAMDKFEFICWRCNGSGYERLREEMIPGGHWRKL